MKNAKIAVLLLGMVVLFVPSTNIAGQRSGEEFRLCAICAGAVSKKSIQLPCDHPICATCLQPWLDKKVMCLRCQEKKQRTISKHERWRSAVYVGLGMVIGGALIGLKKLDDKLSGLHKTSLANVKA
jgi:hypothetical protein